jgi:hypothetical protein
MTSRRAIRARSENYREVSHSSLPIHVGLHTDRTRGPCSHTNGFSLSRYQSSTLVVPSFGSLTGQLLFEILEELVAVLVHADQGSGLGVTCVSSTSPLYPYKFQSPYRYAIIRAVASAWSAGGNGGVDASVPAFGGRIPTGCRC